MMNKILSKLLFAVLAVLFTAEVMAQVPQGFNFQAVARNADGDLIVNAGLGVQVSVLQGSEEGDAVYTETQNPTTNTAGSFQIVIGEGTSEDDFSSINWGSDNFYVKLAIDPAGGTEYKDLGTTRLLSVPYALLAKDVVNGTSSGPTAIDTLNSIQRLQLNNAEDDRAALLLTTSQGLGNLYFFNANQQNTGWFGNNGKGGFMQLVGYEDDGSYIGATLTGMAPWNNNLPYFFMEGSSEDPYVQLVSFGGRLNASDEEVPYFDLQTTQRGIDGKAPAFSIGVVNNLDGNDSGGESTEMFIRGESTPNFQIGGQSWENNNLPFLAMYGSTGDGNDWYHNNLELSVGSDGTDEWGVMSIRKTNILGTSSQETIHIDGNTGNIDIQGTLNQSSDKRLKKDIKTLDNALEKTQKLRGVSYTWKTDDTAENPQIGVIAQEVEEIYPEFVHTDEDGMKSVNYAQMTAVLIEAVKALNEKVEGLQNDNATLQAKVDQQDELESRIADIEKLLQLQNATQISEQTNARK